MNPGIKIIREPSVYLVARQDVDEESMCCFLDDVGAEYWGTDTLVTGEYLIEVAGRNCYQSWKNPRPGGNKAYIKHLLEVGHGSCIEHASWSFIFCGVSRSLTHEIIRHRHFSYAELSQRFVDSSDVAFVVPPALREAVDAAEKRPQWDGQWLPLEAAGLDWMLSVSNAVADYRRLVEYLEETLPATEDKTTRRKQARQAARSVLPECCETKIFVSGNARALRAFIELRASRHADVEIRRLAVMVLQRLQQEAPNLFGDYRLTPLPDGTMEAVTDYRKV